MVKQNIIPIQKWGKDHWSLLAYIESCTVDYNGELNLRKMRVNSTKRPFGNGTGIEWQNSWSTILKEGMEIGHDDIDVLEDLISTELVENLGTLINPRVKLTANGIEIAHEIRKHKAKGGSFKTFNYK